MYIVQKAQMKKNEEQTGNRQLHIVISKPHCQVHVQKALHFEKTFHKAVNSQKTVHKKGITCSKSISFPKNMT